MLKFKAKYNYEDISITFGIDGNLNMSGFQEDVDSVVKNESVKAINLEKDVEISRYNAENLYDIKFEFYNYTSHTYSASYYNVGFKLNDFTYKSDSLVNSYYLAMLYDSIDSNNQNLIGYNYITKQYSENSILYSTPNSEGYYMLIPNYYLNSYTGDTITGYTKYLFYNAKNGKYYLFYNDLDPNPNTEDKYYIKTVIDKTNRTWSYPDYFDNYSGFYPTIHLYEEIDAVDYINKINDKDNFINKKQQYPLGYIFNTTDGKYITDD